MSKASNKQIHDWRNPPDDIIGLTDSYKIGHWMQYMPGTTGIYSYFESRGGLFPAVTYFGGQYMDKRYLAGKVVTREAIDRRKLQIAQHLSNPHFFNEAGWEYILKKHKGRLPVIIRAVPEGATVPVHNVLWTIQETDPKCAWLTNYLETLKCENWYPTTVATLTREMKKIIFRYIKETGDGNNAEALAIADCMLHDFGFRGSTSPESAGIGGMGHLVNFHGTDNMRALDFAKVYYNEPMAAHSIFAAEHSTITSWGREREGDAYENILDIIPNGDVAIVADSYDLFYACRHIFGERLRDKILARNGKTFVRPDTGYPPEIDVAVLDILGEKFGYTTNRKGYKILNPKIGVIQGDRIDIDMIPKIYEAMKKSGWAAQNVPLGSGGGILQRVDRDTQEVAVKCSAAQVNNGPWYPVMKDPITGRQKKSKGGRHALVILENGYDTIPEEEAKKRGLKNELEISLENGEIPVDQSLSEIRTRAAL